MGAADVAVRLRIAAFVAALLVCPGGGAASAFAGGGAGDRPHGAAPATDRAGDCRALRRAAATVQHEEADELHLYWVLPDRPELWRSPAAVPAALRRYRERVQALLLETGPLAMIRRNRELFPWLEREHPAVRAINRLVETGAAGRHRPMSCLENRLLAFQAERFPLFERPTEIAALILRRSAGSPEVKLYALADDDGPPPKPAYALPAIQRDLEDGWRLWATFHNHTLELGSERGHLAIAAPSGDDLWVFRFLRQSFGLELALVADGFSTLELTAEEFERLARAADQAAATGETECAEEPN